MIRITKIIAAILFITTLSSPAFSGTWGLGITSYYSYWVPAYMKTHDNVKVDPVLLVGPVVSYSFYERWVLGFQGVINIQDYETGYSIYVPPAGNVDIRTKNDRHEFEISLMYILTSHFRIFAGYKDFSFDESSVTAKAPSGYNVDSGGLNCQFGTEGLGSGVAYSLSLVDNLKMSLSTSFLYFFAQYTGPVIDIVGTDIYKSTQFSYDYTGYGNNSSITFSYFFPTVDTALNLGARCQYIKYKSKDNTPDFGSDLNYGITFSAIYFF